MPRWGRRDHSLAAKQRHRNARVLFKGRPWKGRGRQCPLDGFAEVICKKGHPRRAQADQRGVLAIVMR